MAALNIITQQISVAGAQTLSYAENTENSMKLENMKFFFAFIFAQAWLEAGRIMASNYRW